MTQLRIPGVLGGMGPETTADFVRKVMHFTEVHLSREHLVDQDHIRMLIDHNPRVPSRPAAVLKNGPDPTPALVSMAVGLEDAGADFLVMPCNSAHVFSEAISAKTTIPLVSIVDITVEAAIAATDGGKIGVLATDGCLQASLYQTSIGNANGTWLIPRDESVEDLMDVIENVKAGRIDAQATAAIADIVGELACSGATVVISGCTEIPLVLRDDDVDLTLISSTDTLAERTVDIAFGVSALP